MGQCARDFTVWIYPDKIMATEENAAVELNGNQQHGECQFSLGGKWRLFFLKIRSGRSFTLLTCPATMGRSVRLPKPATSQFPHESRSLREKWSLIIPNTSTPGPPTSRAVQVNQGESFIAAFSP